MQLPGILFTKIVSVVNFGIQGVRVDINSSTAQKILAISLHIAPIILLQSNIAWVKEYVLSTK